MAVSYPITVFPSYVELFSSNTFVRGASKLKMNFHFLILRFAETKSEKEDVRNSCRIPVVAPGAKARSVIPFSSSLI